MNAYTSKVTSKGQIVIPKQMRIRYGIKTSTPIRWVPRDDGLLMVPDTEDPISKARGLFKGSAMLEKLLADRKTEKDKEDLT